jgi:signal transduction histidine kinase
MMFSYDMARPTPTRSIARVSRAMRSPETVAVQTMSAPSGHNQGPGGLRAWWQRLWRASDDNAPLAPKAVVSSPVPAPMAVPAKWHQPIEVQDEPGRISRETLLGLQAAGPAQEAPPDLVQQRAQFWATATHDLCQPAQALALFLERLRRLPPQTSAEALHGYLQSSMDDLTRLLTGLMELAQIDAGEVQASTMMFSVDDLFSRLNAQLAGQAQAKGLRLAVRSKGQSVIADPALLERILLALGRNALQFCDRGTVLLSARPVQGGAAVRIDVSDSGPGIAERDHVKIFEPFAQRNVANPQGPSRPSLGLHIASRHAGLLGTGLQLRSALGRGSRFSITLPHAVQERRDGDELRTALEAIGLNGLRVVLLDADQERARTVSAWLTSWGCLVANDLNLDAAQTLHAAQGLPAQAVVCAWQADAPLSAGQRIQALRAGTASQIPACIIYADLGAGDDVPHMPAATAVLGQPLQAAQLRAWLRRAVQS